MKKALWILLALLLALTTWTALATAEQPITVFLDGTQLSFDQQPIIENGTTLVPLRAIFEAQEAVVDYDPATARITAIKGDILIQLTVGQATAYKNGVPTTLAVPAKEINGHTLVPLRFISEALGSQVAWEASTSTITITSPGSTAAAPSSSPLKVHYIDVGQADSILVQAPNGKNVLIDGGNNADAQLVVNYLKAHGVQELAAVVATHPHDDHIGGLDVVINTFPVAAVYMPAATTTTRTFEDFITAVNNSGAKRIQAKAGVSLDAGPGITANFLAPVGSNYQDLNDWSAVLHLAYGDTSFLFTGDAEAVSESEMINSNQDLTATVLKVGHHGSSSSTTSKFLSLVAPKYAVISVGEGNSYGHPSPETVAKLNNAGVEVFRTDLAGTIVATSDGQKITFDKKSSPVQERAPTRDAAPTQAPSSTPPEPVASSGSIVIKSVDLDSEIVTLENTGSSPIDLSDWRLVSVEGNQTFTFPAGTSIAAGGTLQVVSGRSASEGPDRLVWTKAYIWNNDGDPAALCDADGNVVAEK